MKQIVFKTNWQYTPFLEDEELTDGTSIDLEYEGKLYEGIKVDVEVSYAYVYGVNLPKKVPFVILPTQEKVQLTSKNVKARRSSNASGSSKGIRDFLLISIIVILILSFFFYMVLPV